ncbi:hypothetical protein KEF85_00445 [Methylomonas paludis]|uniref:Uncharacterized protein n=1 Tax=Methylomonas paludis TaxID=1173101 RepID=A0A975MNF5_9GAMM|nr:hypothetical protein [Methylomonas paludis]QWF71005.1 hypothetical protein KEF85_00445 [Methylomonas paludis]
MNAITTQKSALLLLGHETLINKITLALYQKMLDDYRINRFFNARSAAEQAEALASYVKAAVCSTNTSSEQLHDLLEAYFMASFARNNYKPSLVTGNDFGFLLDIVGGREIRTITLLCDAHGWLMKLGPDDFHYDIMLEHLVDSLRDLAVAEEQAAKIMQIAEAGREGALGRQAETLKAA